jgi:hypothetical protein
LKCNFNLEFSENSTIPRLLSLFIQLEFPISKVSSIHNQFILNKNISTDKVGNQIISIQNAKSKSNPQVQFSLETPEKFNFQVYLLIERKHLIVESSHFQFTISYLEYSQSIRLGMSYKRLCDGNSIIHFSYLFKQILITHLYPRLDHKFLLRRT